MESQKSDSFLTIFLKGLLMGAADVVPGVSGGTMAFITGIYERLIDGLGAVSVALKQLCQKLAGLQQPSWNSVIRTIDWLFFIPLGLGIVTAFLAGSRVIPALMEAFPGPIYAFFGGLIIASALMVFKKINSHKKTEVLCGFLAFLGGLAFSSGTAAGAATAPGYLYIFILGSIAICAMILPGISGAFILLLFGQYEFMLNALRNITTQWGYVLPFMAGAAIGLLVFARFLSYLLHRFHAATLYALTGLMLGALYAPGKIAVDSMTSLYAVLVVVVAALVGFIMVLFIEKAAVLPNRVS